MSPGENGALGYNATLLVGRKDTVKALARAISSTAGGGPLNRFTIIGGGHD
jgi:hypothetical protein